MTLTSVTTPTRALLAALRGEGYEVVTYFPRVEEIGRSYGAGIVRYRAGMKPTSAECRERAAAYLAMARHQEMPA
jgi:hypothetical protein